MFRGSIVKYESALCSVSEASAAEMIAISLLVQDPAGLEAALKHSVRVCGELHKTKADKEQLLQNLTETVSEINDMCEKLGKGEMPQEPQGVGESRVGPSAKPPMGKQASGSGQVPSSPQISLSFERGSLGAVTKW